MTDIAYKPPYKPGDETSPLGKGKLPWETVLLLYGVPYTRSLQASETRSDFFAVPNGKIFFLMNAQLSCTSENVVGESVAYMYIKGRGRDDGGLIRLWMGVNPGVVGDDNTNNANAVMNYRIPVVLNTGETISIETIDSGTDVAGSIYGLMMDSTLFYTLVQT